MNIDFNKDNKCGYNYNNAEERSEHIEKMCSNGYICTHFGGNSKNLAAVFEKIAN